MAESKAIATQDAQAGVREIERIATTGGNSWLAVTHYNALTALARAMVTARIAPTGMAPEQALGVMAFGLELGLGPIASLNCIAFINGRPSMYGDGLMALLMRAGELADMPQESIEGEGDARTATCTLLRKGMATPITRSFSVADAKRAGLWDKAGPWKSYPDRMLRWRAFGWAARDGFADVLRGLWTREEAMDIPVVEAVEVRTVSPAPPPGVVRRPPKESAPAAPQTPTPPPNGGYPTDEHKRLDEALLKLAGGDFEMSRSLLGKYSRFVDDKKREHAADDVHKMSIGWVRATWRKVEPEYEAMLREEEDAASSATSSPHAPDTSDLAAASAEIPF